MLMKFSLSSFTLSSSAPYDPCFSGKICQQQGTRHTFIKLLRTHTDSSGHWTTTRTLHWIQVKPKEQQRLFSTAPQMITEQKIPVNQYLVIAHQKMILHKSCLSVYQNLTNKTQRATQIPVPFSFPHRYKPYVIICCEIVHQSRQQYHNKNAINDI